MLSNQPNLKEPSEMALHIAAQAWCDPNTSHIEMDPELALAFARRVDEIFELLLELKSGLYFAKGYGTGLAYLLDRGEEAEKTLEIIDKLSEKVHHMLSTGDEKDEVQNRETPGK